MALRYGITIILLLVDKVCRPISSLADWQCRGGKDGETAAGLLGPFTRVQEHEINRTEVPLIHVYLPVSRPS